MSLSWRVFAAVLVLAGMAGMFFVFTTALSTGSVPLVAVVVAMFVLLAGSVALYVHTKPGEETPAAPWVRVDWSMSDVCLHVSCTCSPDRVHHLDGYTFGRFRCPDCGQRFRLPARLEASRVTD